MTQTVPICSMAEALQFIEMFVGDATDFVLPIHESLLDPQGVNMAVITDCILARGWMPDGFVQHQHYRLYRYTDFCQC